MARLFVGSVDRGEKCRKVQVSNLGFINQDPAVGCVFVFATVRVEKQENGATKRIRKCALGVVTGVFL